MRQRLTLPGKRPCHGVPARSLPVKKRAPGSRGIGDFPGSGDALSWATVELPPDFLSGLDQRHRALVLDLGLRADVKRELQRVLEAGEADPEAEALALGLVLALASRGAPPGSP